MNNRALRFSLRNKLVVGFALLSFLLTALTTLGFYINLRNQVQKELSQRVLSIAKVAALQQNGDEFMQISSAEDELYEKLRMQNLRIRYADPDVIYVYTMRKDERGIYFVVDAGEPGEEGIAPFGAIYEEPGPTLVDNFDSMDQAIVEPDIYTDEWGSFLSAYAPIYDYAGRKVGVIAVDILADTVLAKQRQVLVQSLVILSVATLLGTLIGYVTGNYLSKPISNLAVRAKAFASGDLEVRVNITTRDEIEELGHAFNDMASQLRGLVTNLETRVSERTIELEESAKQIQKRAEQLQVISDISNSIASLQDIEKLLPQITNTISQAFGFFHVGIFLLDKEKKFAVLHAANSEGGKKMIARNHKLRTGQEGIVGYAVAQKRARIALDVGQDPVFFNNPDLPETRSELALPLLISGDAIGALDVQSEQPGAFSNEDIEVLGTLANQVAVAIENARLFEQAQLTLKELEKTLQRYVQNEWGQYSTVSSLKGYRAHEAGFEPITDLVQTNDKEATKSSIHKTPITLRGVTIGNLDIDLGEQPREYTQEEIDIIQATAERVALALESARLLETSQRQAAKEQKIGEITAKIGASVNMRNVLQTAVEELGRSIPGSEVVIQFQNNQEKIREEQVQHSGD